PRLQALTRPLSAEEARMETVLRNDWSDDAARLSHAEFRKLVLSAEDARMRPLLNRLYRPRATTNIYAAQIALKAGVVQVPASKYREAMDGARQAAGALVSLEYPGYLINPVGKVLLDEMATADALAYLGRMHDTQAMFALVSTQLALRAA